MGQEQLTPRQRQCLEMSATMSDKEIAKVLGLSPHTVSQHIRDARGVLGAATRREARRALTPNLLPASEGIPAAPIVMPDQRVDADTPTVADNEGSGRARFALYDRLGRWQKPPRILGSVSPLILVLTLLILLVMGGGLALLKLFFEAVQLLRS